MPPALQPEQHSTLNLPQSRLIPVDQLPKKRHPYGSKGVVSNASGRIVTPVGVFSHVIDVDGTSGSVGHQPLMDESDGMQGIETREVGIAYVDATSAPELENPASETDANLKRSSKRQRQWRTWSEDIIPALLKPYMSLMQETESLRNIGMVRGQTGCKGCANGRMLDFSCIYFNSKCSIV